MDTDTRAVEQAQFLTFVVAGEEYAVGILRVREIIHFESVTPVPRTPRWIRGVINLRGSIVPVVDLAVKFGLPATQVTPDTCIVIAEVQLGGEETVMGLLADAVKQVIELAADRIEAAPVFGTTVDVDYLTGMGRADERLILMLDVDRVLSTDELVAAAEISARDEADAGAAVEASNG